MNTLEFPKTRAAFLSKWQEVGAYVLELVDVCRYQEDPQDRFVPLDQEALPTELRCWPFVHHIFSKMGVILEQDIYQASRHFHVVPAGAPWAPMDICSIRVAGSFSERHVGLLQDATHMLHCSKATNGVARSELTRNGWKDLRKEFYRYTGFDYENISH